LEAILLFWTARGVTCRTGTGKKTRIGYEGGQRVTRLWLSAKEEEAKGEVEKALTGNRFAILATDSEGVFARWV
jgi:hypothetical protein